MTAERHAKWMAQSKTHLKAVLTAAQERPHRISLSWPGYLGKTIGFSGTYATGRDLTAVVLEMWFTQRDSHGCPDFSISAARKALGDLWDEQLCDEAWALANTSEGAQ